MAPRGAFRPNSSRKDEKIIMAMSRGLDTIITFRVLKLLTTAWEDQAAFEHGLIDDKGKRIKSKKATSSKEKDAYTLLHKLVFNLKRLKPIRPDLITSRIRIVFMSYCFPTTRSTFIS